ncbi:cation diffusion facilitator family transporter [Mucilaginibacter auburnensis]|uniref:Cation diffusion facilitator family transporter n=1 Tax=Mucilaginibacter auburnensis TaxID=1457233 RepID=A0A2H9VVD5_9SPHI|nr:cation diffusion facilitator family transporter [Mucilaginibacter auburnensis]PJJ84777.1 cation diffusion facilitator family transporter [Mucilaginibacter auburnensis]
MASSKKSIYSALAANLLIAVTKFIAGAVSNSSAMIAEGVHSVVDTINQLLLLLGIRLSKKKPDKYHPLGYGKELYFWSFVVSIMIFGLGGGISIYQGILHILHPIELGNPKWSYVVLSLSIVFEGSSLIIAAIEFNKIRNGQSWWQAIVNSKDPSTFLVLFEDAAAVLGLLIVLICLWLSHHLNKPFIDGVASLLVGLLLVFVSMILARESRSLLMGEGISKKTKVRVRAIVEEDASVLRLMHLLSSYQSPEEVLLMLIVAFKPDQNTAQINDAIDRIRDHIKAEYRLIKFVIIQPEVYERRVDPNIQKYI